MGQLFWGSENDIDSDTAPSTSSTQPDTDEPTDEPPDEPPLVCPYCPLPLKEDDLDLPVITLKQKQAVETCNYWAKRRKIDVMVEVG